MGYFHHPTIKELVAFMVPLIDSAQFLAPAQIIQQIRSTFDYDRFIVDEDIPSPDDVKISNINQLQLASARYSTIGAFLKYTDSFQDEGIADDKEGVSLMTVHKAKGLEFPVVFVIGLVEGLMPSSKGNLEEERRICFVAISRAMRHLFLSYPLNYLGQPAKKSMFLDEILGKREPDTRKSAA
jgi:DNA helicase-2/ATP-dependent DNA helicase PcrA